MLKFSEISIFANFAFFANFSKQSGKCWTKTNCRALQRSALCRSRRELSNAYLLAKFGFDTGENEPCKISRPRRAGSALGSSGSAVAHGPFLRCVRRLGNLWPFLQILQKICKILQIFANFWRARTRLYQNEILQENMRLTAFFKLYKICILLHRCNLKIFAKNRFEKIAIFVKFQKKNCKCRKICKILSNFKNFSLRIW